MFDSSVIYLIEWTDINRPRNAITLSQDMHQCFRHFDIFLNVSQTLQQIPIRSKPFCLSYQEAASLLQGHYSHTSIDPPSERLLGLHSVIGHIHPPPFRRGGLCPGHPQRHGDWGSASGRIDAVRGSGKPHYANKGIGDLGGTYVPTD